jgi:hypothetical protein
MLWLMKTNSSISTATSRSFYSADDGGRFLIRVMRRRRIRRITDALSRLAAGHSNLRRDQLMPWNYVPDVA